VFEPVGSSDPTLAQSSQTYSEDGVVIMQNDNVVVVAVVGERCNLVWCEVKIVNLSFLQQPFGGILGDPYIYEVYLDDGAMRS